MFLSFFNKEDRDVITRVNLDKEPRVSRAEERAIARAEAKAAKAEARAEKRNRK